MPLLVRGLLNVWGLDGPPPRNVEHKTLTGDLPADEDGWSYPLRATIPCREAYPETLNSPGC